jgi:hypothetical protein
MERISNSGGNLEVLGHTVVLEMENEQSLPAGQAGGKLYLLKNENNVASIPGFASFLWSTVQDIKDFRPLFGKEFQAGPYTVKITDLDPAKFTFAIAGVPVKYRNLELSSSSFGTTYETTCTITARVLKESLRLEFPRTPSSKRGNLFDPMEENVSAKWNIYGSYPAGYGAGGAAPPPPPPVVAVYTLTGLNLRQVTEALLNIIEEARRLPPAQEKPTVVPGFLLDSAGKIGCSPVNVVFEGIIRARADAIGQKRAQALIESINRIIDNGITSQEDIIEITDILSRFSPIGGTKPGVQEITLKRSGKRLVYQLVVSDFGLTESIIVADDNGFVDLQDRDYRTVYAFRY